MKIVRAVRHVRIESAHSSTGTRERAIQAQQLLGLPDIISDWAGARAMIQDQLAGAFDVIRQEVQTAPQSDDSA